MSSSDKIVTYRDVIPFPVLLSLQNSKLLILNISARVCLIKRRTLAIYFV